MYKLSPSFHRTITEKNHMENREIDVPTTEEDDDDLLALTLSTIPSAPPPAARARRPPRPAPERWAWSPTIEAPYPWATDRRAVVHSLEHLEAIQISAIRGDVECRQCQRRYSIEFDLQAKVHEVFTFVAAERDEMRQRAPKVWLSPPLLQCRVCYQMNSVRPVMAEKKKMINWLFLLLGQMLGFCTLGQLKYFCKHTKNHRTGAKDRVLYLAYLELCKQLDPRGPFDVYD